MKKYTVKHNAFKHALRRATNEDRNMLVLFSKKFRDVVVRADVGQSLTLDQVLVAKIEANDNDEWEVFESKHHNLELK